MSMFLEEHNVSKGVSVRTATDQNLLPLTGSAALIIQQSFLTLHCQQLYL